MYSEKQPHQGPVFSSGRSGTNVERSKRAYAKGIAAGVIAELEGKTVAAAIAAEIGGQDSPAPFDGNGFCFIEMGKKSAARVQGDFFNTPEPDIQLAEPSSENAEAKRRFESERLQKWFA